MVDVSLCAGVWFAGTRGGGFPTSAQTSIRVSPTSSVERHVGRVPHPGSAMLGRVPHPWSAMRGRVHHPRCAMRGRVPHPGSAGALAGPSPFYVTRIGPCPRWHLRRGKSQSTASCETLPARAPALPGGLTRMATLGFTSRPTTMHGGFPTSAQTSVCVSPTSPVERHAGACPSPWERRRPRRPITPT